ncbi:MAG TPA: PfkB family carbohydrate kinase [Chthoniobacterales bacterium]|nr:PfkB family carbohydrate kinase [Chthoniobacterales bacterium]
MTIIGAGLMTVDIIQEVSPDWRPLERPPAYASGGTVCNILCHLAHGGWNARVIGSIGDDKLGKLVRSDLSKFRIDCSALLDVPNTPTRRILHKIVSSGVDRGKHKFELFCSKCRRPFPPVAPPQYRIVEPSIRGVLGKDTVLIVDRANELTTQLVEQVEKSGGTIIFEPGHLPRSSELVSQILAKVDILKYSRELMWKHQPLQKMIDQMAMPKIKIVIETRGQSGVQIKRANRRKRLVAQALPDIRDSAGAGDAFMAGFLLGLGSERLLNLDAVSDLELETAIQRGQARGGLACVFLGSKGVLYNHSHEKIEIAVNTFISTLHYPEGFGSDSLRGAECEIGIPTNGSCPTCGLK